MYRAGVSTKQLTTIPQHISVKSARTARALTVRGCATAVTPGPLTHRALSRLEGKRVVAVAGLV